MKKNLILFGLTVFFISNFSIANAQEVDISNGFLDVEKDSKYYASIEYFREKGVIQGYTDGTFRPEQEANRAEALKILLLTINANPDELQLTDPVFPDVEPEDWYFKYVQKGYELALIQGYDDGTFKPEQIQNIAETLKIILVSFGVTPNSIDPDQKIYPDVTGDFWFAPYAAYAKEQNIIEPQADGSLGAINSITRGELVELMYRMNMVKHTGEPFDISTNWPVYTNTEHGFKTKKPHEWVVVNNEDQVVLWRKDEVNDQSSYEVSFPYSASITFHLDPEGTHESILNTAYSTAFGSYQKNEITINGYEVIEYNVSIDHDDFFFQFPDDHVLHAYTSHGWSALTDQLVLEIQGIIENVEYIKPSSSGSDSDLGSSTSNDVMTTARSNILVEGSGQATLDLFDNLLIIETDTIGVGTGPIDYYYSDDYDVTLKYERASDTVLDIQDGNTSAF